MKLGMRFLLVIIILFSYSISIAQSNSLIRLSQPIDSLPKECLLRMDNDVVIQISTNHIVPGLNCKVDNIDYFIGIDKFNKIVFYAVYDTNFISKSFGYITQNKSSLDSIKKSKIIYESGWAAYVKLPDGWNLAFDNKDILKKGSVICLKNNAVPKFLFKRREDYNNGAIVPKSWGKSRQIEKND